ncbi:MAG: ammonium transporter, partial [Cyanobacteria bacterium P01_A01_bin.37]
MMARPWFDMLLGILRNIQTCLGYEMGLSSDELWIILSALLVFLMQAGFLCLEAGSTRRKNNINVAFKNIADLGISIVIFWGIGYGIMFGNPFHGWIGTTQLFPELSQGEPWPAIFFLFQAMFCSTAVTILSGAAAERMTLKGYLIITCLISGIVYPVFGHWAWNGIDSSKTTGWLGQSGFIDFAGSTVVHSLGGWVALATVLVIGPRMGRFSKKRAHYKSPSSDIPLALLGTLLLWFGWFGFNGGSTLAINAQVPGILVNTLLAGAAGLTAPLLWGLVRQQTISVNLVMNGALAGLVAVTANCQAVSSLSALMIGAVGGGAMILLSTALNHWHIDDAVGAIPVHLGGGIWGTLAVAIFGDLDRLGTDLTRLAQLKIQISGILACGLWSFTMSLIVLLLLNRYIPLRVNLRQEYLGLNVAEHNASSELQDLYATMRTHVRTGELKRRATANSLTEIGQISQWYNQVVQTLERVIARIDAIITTAADGIVTIDPQTLVIQSTNPAIEKIFGHSWLRIIGQPLTILMGADYRNNQSIAIESLYRLLEQGCHTGDVLEVIGIHRQGRRFPIEITATASRVGSDCFWTIMVRDITIRKKAEAALQKSELKARRNADRLKTAIEQLKQAQTQLLQGEKMASLGHLVAGIAHEINNPVSFIHGNLTYANEYVHDLLQVLALYQEHCSQLPPEAQEGIEKLEIDFLQEDFPRLIASMQTGTMRIRDIVQSLRNFSRYDEAEIKVVDIHEGIDSTLLMLFHRLNAMSSRPEIRIQKDYGALQKIECYAGALNQVFLNILSNAIDALGTCQEATPTITITTQQYPESVKITISDNGPGIPRAVQQKIFDPFFTTKTVGKGTGMGLAISHQIVVESHGGELDCQSIPGQGTEFLIT